MQELPELKPHRSPMQRRCEIAAAIATVVILVVAAFALPAAGQADPEANNPAYWGEDCFKIDDGTGSDEYVATDDFRLVVLKSGNVNDEFYDVKAGDVLATTSGQDVSHLILCEGVTTTTTAPESTTTTVPESTTTTVPESTTTVPESTTTVPESTTTTQPESTTTTQPESTTTTEPPPTPTTEPPTEAPPSTLPYTGPVGPVDYGLLGLAAVALVGLGAAGILAFSD